jgi:hypothetical protein
LIFREVEDPELIAHTRRGKVEAYSLLVSRWEKRVFHYLVRLVRQPRPGCGRVADHSSRMLSIATGGWSDMVPRQAAGSILALAMRPRGKQRLKG